MMNLKQYTTLLTEIKARFLEVARFKINIKEAVLSGKYIYDYRTNKAKYAVDRIKKQAAQLLGIIEKLHKAAAGGKNKKLEEAFTRLVIDTKFIEEYYLEPDKALEETETAGVCSSGERGHIPQRQDQFPGA
jgi:hypothetical protein